MVIYNITLLNLNRQNGIKNNVSIVSAICVKNVPEKVIAKFVATNTNI